jgi:hypothetical protein
MSAAPTPLETVACRCRLCVQLLEAKKAAAKRDDLPVKPLRLVPRRDACTLK